MLKGALVLLLFLSATLSFSQSSIPIVTSKQVSITSIVLEGSNFGKTNGVLKLRPMVKLTPATRNAGFDEGNYSHLLSGLDSSNYILVNVPPSAWADTKIILKLSTNVQNDITNTIKAAGIKRLNYALKVDEVTFDVAVERADTIVSDWK